jgi:hypothetical protein
VGQLPDVASDLIAEHLESCATCQSDLMTLDNAEDTLVNSLQQRPAADSVVAEPQCQLAIGRACALAEDGESHQADRTGPLRSGDQLGEYRLLEELGHGGMGHVYRALQTKLDRVVALKVLATGRARDHRAITRFEREMKAIGRLEHPHIVRAHDAREIDGNPVLVMEYVEGLDLSRLLRACGRVKVADACELVRQAAIGLQYAHENGLVHRDIKPSNLMLTPQGQVKLLDLGLARRQTAPASSDELTGAGQPMGTADYIAPEQVSDSRAVDIRADIYSLGCTLYKLLTGRAPFADSDARGTFDILTAHVNTPAPTIRQFDATLPEQLVGLLDRMLAKSPDDRPATPGDVATSLASFCGGSDLVALAARAVAEEAQRNRAGDNASDVRPRAEKPRLLLDSPATTVTRGGWFWGVIGVAILMAAAGGFALGVIITIRWNGKSAQLEVPDGSTVKIGEQGKVDVKVPASQQTTAPPQPLAQGPPSPDKNETTSQPRIDTRPVQKPLTLYLDESGKLQFDGEGPYPVALDDRPSSAVEPERELPQWIKSLKIRKINTPRERVTLTYHPNAPREILAVVNGSLSMMAYGQVTPYAVPSPNTPDWWIDFRIAATWKTGTQGELSTEVVQQYLRILPFRRMQGFTLPRLLTEQDLDPTPIPLNLEWFVSARKYKEIDENLIISTLGPRNAIPRTDPPIQASQEYILLKTDPSSVMLAADPSWRVVRAEKVKHETGSVYIQLELDEVGNKMLGDLTKSHPNQPLAILINNKVDMVMKIKSDVPTRVWIMGEFTDRFADEIVTFFNTPQEPTK